METGNTSKLPNQNPKEPSSGRLVITLGVAGFISGTILVITYLITLPIIKANKAEALEIAIFKVLPGVSTYNPLELQEDKLVKILPDDADTKADGGLIIYAGFNESGELIGFAIPGTEPGFQDIIVGIFGYNAVDRAIIGLEVLESKETPGLGDKIMKDENFKKNFIRLKVDPELIYVKPGQKKHPNEIETITGATITSKAIVRLLQKGIEKWQKPIEEYIVDNDLTISNKQTNEPQ